MLHECFGDDALMRQLHISDLTDEEMKCLKNEGMLQLLHSRDSVGRRTFFAFFGPKAKFDTQIFTVHIVTGQLCESITLILIEN